MQKGDVGEKHSRDLINWSEVARRLGLSPRYVVMLRRGQRKNEERLRQIENLIKTELVREETPSNKQGGGGKPSSNRDRNSSASFGRRKG